MCHSGQGRSRYAYALSPCTFLQMNDEDPQALDKGGNIRREASGTYLTTMRKNAFGIPQTALFMWMRNYILLSY